MRLTKIPASAGMTKNKKNQKISTNEIDKLTNEIDKKRIILDRILAFTGMQ